ncbi:MerR family transcriptional regulator [Shewanella sp. KT0246]|uniref:MerR family transcriptional regulator n=1 Tax=Shewanella sp. KT0246 TaxID=2815912 RepID=UPI001BBF2BED|nr:MerR family transcriptional regulator [Shewanella sp. KT0246]GIU53937.1 putative heavy metal-dependent transcriptional regulator [Shewanella sp. KT0246]
MLTTEIANLVGVTPETVRFYTRKGLIIASRDPNNGYKVYDQAAADKLMFITHARNIGFSLKQIEEIIDSSQSGQSPCPTVREMLNNKIIETKHKIEQYQKHLVLMENTYAEWQLEPDMTPNGKSICCLIDDWSDKHQVNFTKEKPNDN